MSSFAGILSTNFRQTTVGFSDAVCIARCIVFHILALFPFCVSAQTNPSALYGIANTWKENQQRHYHETVSVIFDRPLYLSGEEAWFSLQCTDAVSGNLSQLSKIAYIEVFDADNKPLYQGMVGLEEGKGGASFAIPFTAGSGFYGVRAYTAWMKNQTPDQWYQGYITVVNPFRNPGLPERSTRWRLSAVPEGGKLVAGLRNRLAYRIFGSDTATSKRILILGDDLGDTLTIRELYNPERGFIEFTPISNRSYTLQISEGSRILGQVELGEIHRSGVLVRPVRAVGNAHSCLIEANEVSYPLQLILHRNGVLLWHRVLSEEEANNPILLPEQTAVGGQLLLLVLDSEGTIAGEHPVITETADTNFIEVKTDRNRYSPGENIRMSISMNEAAGTGSELSATITVYRWAKSLEKQHLLELDLQSQTGTETLFRRNSGAFTGAESNPDCELQAAFNHIPTTPEQLQKWTRPAKIWLPEIRGPVVAGRVFNKRSMQPVQYATVFLSKTGPDWQFFVSRSDTAGKVRFEISGFNGERRLIMQPGPDSIRSLAVVAEQPFSNLVPYTVNMPFDLDESLAGYLLELSIAMQIRHDFLGHFRHQFEPIPLDTIPFYGTPDERYYLGNYTRFPVMEEVMREYVRGVLVRRRRGTYYFRLLDTENQDVFRREPLVLLDGIPVDRTDAIMEYDPLKINRIDVITRKYVIGHEVADGLVSYSSYRGDHPGFTFGEDIVVLPYPGLEAPRRPWLPPAEGRANTRIPDYRNLMYWNPGLKIAPLREETIEFQASDQTGTYRIEVYATGPDGGRITGYCSVVVGNDEKP